MSLAGRIIGACSSRSVRAVTVNIHVVKLAAVGLAMQYDGAVDVAAVGPGFAVAPVGETALEIFLACTGLGGVVSWVLGEGSGKGRERKEVLCVCSRWLGGWRGFGMQMLRQ